MLLLLLRCERWPPQHALFALPAGRASPGLYWCILSNPRPLQDGVLLNCERWSPWQDCDQRGRYPGLFEVPGERSQSISQPTDHSIDVSVHMGGRLSRGPARAQLVVPWQRSRQSCVEHTAYAHMHSLLFARCVLCYPPQTHTGDACCRPTAAAWDLSGNGLFATNASERGGRSVYDTLRQAFDASYAGNRAPLPVYVHSSFFTAENVRDMQQFAGA